MEDLSERAHWLYQKRILKAPSNKLVDQVCVYGGGAE